jgi:hypothetical protein
MKRVLLLLVMLSFIQPVFSQPRVDSLIDVLKKEIENQNVYVDQKLQRIKALRKQLPTVEKKTLAEQFDLYNAFYQEYKTFIYDSAFRYAQRLIYTAYRMKDKSRIGYAHVKLGFILLSSGMFKETFDSLQIVNANDLPDTSRTDYYRLLARAYSDLSIYNNDSYYRNFYAAMDLKYMDSAFMWIKPDSYSYYYFTTVKQVHLGNYKKAIETVQTLLSRKKLSNPQLAVNYYDMAQAYAALGNEGKTVEYLVLSSLSDLRAATKETAAMYTLASLLHRKGDNENAYVFIRQALSDAEFYGARQRKVEIGSVLPLIVANQLDTVEGKRKRLLFYTIGLFGMVVTITGFSIALFRQFKKVKAAEAAVKQANLDLQEINHKLQESDKIKEEYIGYYFSNNSDYIDKIETFKRNIDRKLQHHKVDDIKYVVSTLHPEQEREKLYFNFDKIFLSLFPNFVQQFNAYFEPADRIILKENQLLNTELRIFALIRLGIHDTEKIARTLGYSVNTIYAYKNRAKNKSILPNDKFEEKIMEIKTVPLSGTINGNGRS